MPAIEVSDCPTACTPAGERSSEGVAASTLVPNEAVFPVIVFVADLMLVCPLLQYISAPDEAWRLTPSRLHKAFLFAGDTVFDTACTANGRRFEPIKGALSAMAISSATLKMSFDVSRLRKSISPL